MNSWLRLMRARGRPLSGELGPWSESPGVTVLPDVTVDAIEQAIGELLAFPDSLRAQCDASWANHKFTAEAMTESFDRVRDLLLAQTRS